MSRRCRRYTNRQIKRSNKRKSYKVKSLEEAFTFQNVYKRGIECCKGVRWKTSTLNHEYHNFSESSVICDNVLNGTYKWSPYNHFRLSERGKTRDIDAPCIRDRQVQKVLAQDILLPVYKNYLIYNNGASLKGKGLSFSQRILKRDLRNHFKKYGLMGWVIISDCKGFFPNADHDYIKNIHKEVIIDSSVCKLLDSVIETATNGSGVPLGVESSQLEMVMYPWKLDAYMKCQLSLKGAGHYMDDYYMLVPPYEDPYEVLDMFICKARECKLEINKDKTHIIPFGKPFRYCKTKYMVTSTGKIITHGSPKTSYRTHRKFRVLKQKISNCQITYQDLWSIAQSFVAYYKVHNDHGRILRLSRYFYKLYGFNMLCFKEYRMRDENSYIAHQKYKGKNVNGDTVMVARGKRLVAKGNVLYYQNTPICRIGSRVARMYFALDSDGKGLERGGITSKIAYSNTRYLVNNWSTRFNKQQAEIICSDKWNKYIDKFHQDVIIFNDTFFNADVSELQELYSELQGVK